MLVKELVRDLKNDIQHEGGTSEQKQKRRVLRE
jgi:hypothetical protein